MSPKCCMADPLSASQSLFPLCPEFAIAVSGAFPRALRVIAVDAHAPETAARRFIRFIPRSGLWLISLHFASIFPAYYGE